MIFSYWAVFESVGPEVELEAFQDESRGCSPSGMSTAMVARDPDFKAKKTRHEAGSSWDVARERLELSTSGL